MIIYLLIIFIMLQIADVISTYKSINNGGIELNPIMKWLFEKIGVLFTLIIVKTIACVGMIYLVLYCNNKYWNYTLIFICLIYIAVVYNNFKFIKNK